jgi:hypothetical protein
VTVNLTIEETNLLKNVVQLATDIAKLTSPQTQATENLLILNDMIQKAMRVQYIAS